MSPAALLRACATPGCPHLTSGVLCSFCTANRAPARGSASQRGYGVVWRQFNAWVIRRMVVLNITPVCGATLPGGPSLALASQCRAKGLLNPFRLHLHHDPPLRSEERSDPQAVCNPARVGLLCESCHATETRR